MPLVSVVVPAFNAARTLEETIASVQRQTVKDWEMLIVDDGSADETFPIAHKWAMRDPRIKAISQKNSGAAVARNSGIERAAGRYVAFLDADDHWLPAKIERQTAFMERTGASFSFTAYRKFWYPGVMGEVIPATPRVGYKTLLKSRPIALSTVMVLRSLSVRFPAVDKAMPEDLAAWLCLTRDGVEAFGLNEDLMRYRTGGRSANKLLAAFNVWRVYRETARLSAPMAAWYFVHYAINAVVGRI